MSEPDPTYTATYPDAQLITENGTMPEWFKLYLLQRRRALITELKAIEKALGIKP
jgi:hypothetical protein